MKIKFDEVITENDLKNLSASDYLFAIEKGSIRARELKSNPRKSLDFLERKARELSASCRYEDKNNTTKELIAAEIVFSNNDLFISTLIEEGYVYEKIKKYMSLLVKIKQLNQMASVLEISEEVELGSKVLTNLCRKIQKNFSICDYNLILAKINEIVFYHKEEYLKKEIEMEKAKTGRKK